MKINTTTLHLEPTNSCTLKCSMCPRTLYETRGGFHFQPDWFSNLSIDLFERITLCGTFGEPTNYKYLFELIDFINNSDKKPWITICSNGSSYSKEWWNNIAKTLPKDNHSIVFSLDGIGKSHERYRVNSKFDTVIRNAVSFIKSGGNAIWYMILFKHNEHEVELARKLSRDLGFISFVVRPSHSYNDKFERPEKNIIKTRYELFPSNKGYSCRIHNGEIFINCYGNAIPCCYMTSTTVSRQIVGGPFLSVRKMKLKEILESGYFNRILSRLDKVGACSFCKVDTHDIVGNTIAEVVKKQEQNNKGSII